MAHIEEIHISTIDDYIATQLFETSKTLGFLINRLDSQGFVTIEQYDTNIKIEEGGIDFELSPSEYHSLDNIDILDFTKTTIYTSSAYEFFDFILMYFSFIECILDFDGNSWRVRILKFEESDKK